MNMWIPAHVGIKRNERPDGTSWLFDYNFSEVIFIYFILIFRLHGQNEHFVARISGETDYCEDPHSILGR